MTSLIYQELSEKVLGAAFTVDNALGPGLLKSAYEGALCPELNSVKALNAVMEAQPINLGNPTRKKRELRQRIFETEDRTSKNDAMSSSTSWKRAFSR